MATVYYAVIDTNVLVSAILSGKSDAATVQILKKIFSYEIVPVYSPLVYAEYKEVFSRPKFNFSKDQIKEMLDVIKKCGIIIEPHSTNVTLPDLKDVPFYEVAFEKQDNRTFLVTGNIRHFPRAPFVVTPREFINIINSESLI